MWKLHLASGYFLGFNTNDTYCSWNSNFLQSANTQFYSRQKMLDKSLIDQHLIKLLFYENKRIAIFRGQNILGEGVFVTQLSSNVGISVIKNWNKSGSSNNNLWLVVWFQELENAPHLIHRCSEQVAKKNILNKDRAGNRVLKEFKQRQTS